MTKRRSVILGLPIFIACSVWRDIGRAEEVYEIEQLDFPPIDAIGQPEQFGYSAPTEIQKAKVADIIRSTPKGPRPVDIAQSFVDRFFRSDPDVYRAANRPKSHDSPDFLRFSSRRRFQRYAIFG